MSAYMRNTACLVAVVVVALGIVMLVLAARVESGPSCKERGGKSQFTHFLHIYQPATKTMMMVPQYSCVGAKR